MYELLNFSFLLSYDHRHRQYPIDRSCSPFFSIIAGKAGFRFGVPVLLLFLGVGMLFGSDGLGIQFNNPHGAQFIGMIALSIILFSGGMDTKYTEIKPVLGQGVILATLGVALTTAITGFFIYWITGLVSDFLLSR